MLHCVRAFIWPSQLLLSEWESGNQKLDLLIELFHWFFCWHDAELNLNIWIWIFTEELFKVKYALSSSSMEFLNHCFIWVLWFYNTGLPTDQRYLNQGKHGVQVTTEIFSYISNCYFICQLIYIILKLVKFLHHCQFQVEFFGCLTRLPVCSKELLML